MPTYVGGLPPPPVTPQDLLVWRDSLIGADARPTFDSHAVYFLGIHTVYAVDKTTGALLWTTPLTYPGSTGYLEGYGTAVAAGRVIIGDVDVFGLDPQSGTIMWRFAPRTTYPSERSFQRLTTDGVTVYVGGVWGNVYAVDAASGVERWVSHVTTMPDSFVRVFNPVVANGVVYAAFADDKPSAGPAAVVGGVAAFDAGSGQLLWSQLLPHLGGGVSTETSSVVFTGTRVVSAALDGFLYGLDPRTGALVDTVSQTLFGFTAGNPNGGGWFCLGVQDTVLAVGVSNGVMIALDARNIKRKLWTATLNWGAVMDLTVDSERVYTGYAGGQFGVTDIATGKAVWLLSNYYFRPNQEAILWGPAVDGSRIYVAADRDLYAFKWR